MPQSWPRSFLSGAVALALVAGSSARASAQSATIISGRVTSKTGGPIAGASVSVDGSTIGTVTNDAGNYTLTVPAGRTGSVDLTARLIGYRSLRQPVTLTGGR